MGQIMRTCRVAQNHSHVRVNLYMFLISDCTWTWCHLVNIHDSWFFLIVVTRLINQLIRDTNCDLEKTDFFSKFVDCILHKEIAQSIRGGWNVVTVWPRMFGTRRGHTYQGETFANADLQSTLIVYCWPTLVAFRNVRTFLKLSFPTVFDSLNSLE